MNRSEWDPRFDRLPPSQPTGWVDPPRQPERPLAFTPEGTLIDDGYYVEPGPVIREPWTGWDLEPERSPRWAWFGLGICIGVILMAVVTLLRPLIDGPAPSETREPAASQAVLESRGAPRDVGASSPRTEAQVPSPSAAPTGEVGTALIGGWATWYDVGPGLYAAAGPELRAALGGTWRHSVVDVAGPGRLTVRVELVDFCACGDRHGQPTLLDLSIDAFEQLAPLEQGIVSVSIEIPGSGSTLPPTDLPPHPDDDRMRDEVRGDELYR